MSEQPTVPLNRRAFLRNGTLVIAAAAVAGESPPVMAEEVTQPLKIGLVTDLHHADKPTVGTRHYQDTLGKLAEAAGEFERRKVDFIVELGDLIDAADTVETERHYLRTINREFAAISRDRHYVLGNHCVDMLTKAEFLDGVEKRESYYAFDRGGYHFVVLDACFRSDGEPYGRKNSQWNDAKIPAAELEWLKGDLAAVRSKNAVKNAAGAAVRKTIVFAHQRLDVATDHGVKNSAAVREILEGSGQILAVFQGHSHMNDLREIGGIPYCTLAAMIEGPSPENNSYSLLTLPATGPITLTGFRVQKGYEWR
ncbi:MAG: alkaline phosphatase [Planctomyces sp.]|nr:alkaline phosphatase [Planctomyces sp.]